MNTIGFQTLFSKEVRRFMKVWGQTLISPLVTTSLYFLVFGVALGAQLREVGGVRYIDFVVPGLVMLTLINNSFLNTASSLFQSKINGTVVDLLVAPLGATELLLAYVGGGIIRGCLVGGLVYLVAILFTGVTFAHPLFALFFAVSVAALFAALGLATALWAEKFDHLNVVPSFILTPMTFLGGVFYDASSLPAPWNTISEYNPILYMISGFRYGLLGVSEVSPVACVVVTATLLVLTLWGTYVLLARGYKLRQ